MASILKVDELQGITSAGDITVTSEGGAATQSLQQGLAKVWSNYDQTTPASRGGLNVSSITDESTGSYTVNYASNLSSTDDMSINAFADGGGSEHWLQTVSPSPSTGQFRTATRNSSSVSTDTTWAFTQIHGDLA